MKVHISFRQMEPSEALKNHVQLKCEKLQKFVGESFQANCVLVVESKSHVAELRVHGPHIDYHSIAKSEDMYRSVEDVVDKMEKQLRRHKETVKNHLHRDRNED